MGHHIYVPNLCSLTPNTNFQNDLLILNTHLSQTNLLLVSYKTQLFAAFKSYIANASNIGKLAHGINLQGSVLKRIHGRKF
jgi:hypothetical protein